MAGSAQCRSSITIRKGRLAAIASRKLRHAANDSSRSAETASVPSPTRGANRALIQSRSASCSTTASTAFASLSPARPGPSFSTIPACDFTISPSAQNVMPSPYGRQRPWRDRKSTRLNSSHVRISYAVFCLKKKKKKKTKIFYKKKKKKKKKKNKQIKKQ